VKTEKRNELRIIIQKGVFGKKNLIRPAAIIAPIIPHVITGSLWTGEECDKIGERRKVR
jgi:hypothetical protein